MPAHAQSVSGDVFSQRALNRALLARQMLLRRAELTVADALEHVVGMQAQAPNPPYLGLWTRLKGFAIDDLATLIRERKAVRIALMRATIFLVTARDALRLRAVLHEGMVRWGNSVYRKGLEGVDVDALAAAGRALVEDEPRTWAELGPLLSERWPAADRAALGGMARTILPLVQVPPRGIWGESGPAAHTTVEHWLGQPLAPETALDEMVMRYLAAFGPASVRDAQHWCGLKRLNVVIDRLRPRLASLRDENGTELFDLPGAPRPDAETPAPVRFLPEFDNVLLSHADRARIISEEDRARVFTVNGIIRATILVDGFVRGMWTIEKARDAAVLVIHPFAPLAPADRRALEDEGERLVRFAAADASSHAVRFA
jgi:hypothetical protein